MDYYQKVLYANNSDKINILQVQHTRELDYGSTTLDPRKIKPVHNQALIMF